MNPIIPAPCWKAAEPVITIVPVFVIVFIVILYVLELQVAYPMKPALLFAAVRVHESVTFDSESDPALMYPISVPAY